MAELHINEPQADLNPGPDYYQRCKDWVEEIKLLLKGQLATKSKKSTGKLCDADMA